MLKGVDENPFPASIEITLRRDYQSAAAAAQLEGEIKVLGGVDTVRYAGDWLNFLSRCRGYFLAGVLVLAAVLSIALFTAIFNCGKAPRYTAARS